MLGWEAGKGLKVAGRARGNSLLVRIIEAMANCYLMAMTGRERFSLQSNKKKEWKMGLNRR